MLSGGIMTISDCLIFFFVRCCIPVDYGGKTSAFSRDAVERSTELLGEGCSSFPEESLNARRHCFTDGVAHCRSDEAV